LKGKFDDRQHRSSRDLGGVAGHREREARAERGVMCALRFVGTFVRAILLVVALALTPLMPDMLVGLVIWPLIWLAWDRVPVRERISASTVIELLPFAIAAQVALDSLVPYFGDVVVLVVNVMIVATLRRTKLPEARVHRIAEVRARQERVQRVICSRQAAARAASACEGARRAS
jgi:hypothetical protein